MSNTSLPRWHSQHVRQRHAQHRQRQTSLSNLQENLTSGKRVVRASDDPVAAAQAERALTRMSASRPSSAPWKRSATPLPRPKSAMGDAVGLVQERARTHGECRQRHADPQRPGHHCQPAAKPARPAVAVANRKDTNGVPCWGPGQRAVALPGAAEHVAGLQLRGPGGPVGSSTGVHPRTRWMAIRPSCSAAARRRVPRQHQRHSQHRRLTTDAINHRGFGPGERPQLLHRLQCSGTRRHAGHLHRHLHHHQHLTLSLRAPGHGARLPKPTNPEP
jgi:hypothetical protein